MYLARWVATKSKKNKVTVDCDYIYNMQLNFNNEEMINFLPFWLESQKAEDGRSALSDRTDYQNIVLQLDQLKYCKEIFTRKGQVATYYFSSGKSYVISAWQNLLSDVCIVASYVGIAAFNIARVTLCSLMRLPINMKNASDLKGKTSAQLEDKLKLINYTIIDEYSAIGQKMFGWIDRRLRQISGLIDTVFGGFSIILVGDIAQLQPAWDRTLYCPVSEDPKAMMGFFAFRKIDGLKLDQNIRSSLDPDIKNLGNYYYACVMVNLQLQTGSY